MKKRKNAARSRSGQKKKKPNSIVRSTKVDQTNTTLEMKNPPENPSGIKEVENPTTISDKRKTRIVAFVNTLLLAMFLCFFTTPFEEVEKMVIHRLSSFHHPPCENKKVEVIDIQDEDRRVLFNRQNDPLNPETLYKIVLAVAKFKPHVIGIDVATSDAVFNRLNIDETEIPMIWAELPVIDENEQIIGTLAPLGGKSLPRGHHEAVAASPVDSDRFLRFYQRFVDVASEKTISFPFKIFNLSKNQADESAASDSKLRYIEFVNSAQETFRPHISATELLDKAAEMDAEMEERLKGKVVLLGGSYSGQDRVETPVGRMLGIDLQATIIETELNGGSRIPMHLIVKLLFAIITNIFMLLVFDRSGLIPAILINLGTCSFLAVLIALIWQDPIGGVILFLAFMFSLFGQIINKCWDIFKNRVKAEATATST